MACNVKLKSLFLQCSKVAPNWNMHYLVISAYRMPYLSFDLNATYFSFENFLPTTETSDMTNCNWNQAQPFIYCITSLAMFRTYKFN